MRAVNLIPADQRGGASRRAGRSQGAAYAVLGLLAGLALLAVAYGVARHQVSDRTSKAVALETRVQQVQAEAAKLAPYSSFIALREQRVQAVSQLVNSRFDWAHAFHELGRVLPANVAITALAGAVGSTTGPAGSGPASGPAHSTGAGAGAGGSVASATPPGSVPTFNISGCAKTQSTVALTLERLRLIDGVSAVSLVSSTKSAAGGGSTGSTGGGACPGSYPVFNVLVTFDALPLFSGKSSPPATAPVSSTSGATKPTGALR
ncbi:MAG TPA: hypothetical protein VNZ01_00905 [Solirubrobacteraceae bacterium]|jgi:hypothetical protein|nr:hypothetical protein [Solirubrobacteraceae bacterium]